MELVRDIINDLKQWKESPFRKPLVLQGARQVGKSWILEKFGKTCFQNYIRINFEAEEELKKDFARTKDPQRIWIITFAPPLGYKYSISRRYSIY